ncbi:NADAR domain-containing protein [Frankia sp. AgB32]|uniref:NADAR domain-containing protein n=1 Tax=Frankia sp. AgB32 TaxID=631119 RepID=UPI0027E2214B|nr:NADAR domain-containing protein [Frankia sp. AgB32]
MAAAPPRHRRRRQHREFAQGARLRHYLLGTGADILVEASPVDDVWAIGLAADDDRARRLARPGPARPGPA